jgi:hypothetical protein
LAHHANVPPQWTRPGSPCEGEDADRTLPEVKALYTIGYSTDRIHESFVLPPGIDFLPKPYGPASLARRVREVLDKV